jgi:hypothetical protein
VDAKFAKDDRRRSRTVKSCGPDAPMAGVKLLRSSRFLGATVTNKLWSRRGEHGISRKPLRREGRSVSAEPVCSCAFSLSALHMRPRVQRAPGLPCALSFFGGERICKTRAQRCRENADVCHRPRRRTIQYSETPTMESRTRGVLDTPPSRSMTAVGGASSSTSLRGAKRRSNPALSLRLLDCFAIARNDVPPTSSRPTSRDPSVNANAFIAAARTRVRVMRPMPFVTTNARGYGSRRGGRDDADV